MPLSRDPLSDAQAATTGPTSLPFAANPTPDDDLRRLRALIERLPAGVLVEDAEGRVVLANRRLCMLFDLAAGPDALVGAERAVLGEAVASPAPGELVHPADGRVYERDVVPIWEDDAYGGRLWLFWDTTERVRAAAELEAARDAAVDAARAKADFLAMMSHEIRTPMNGIVGTLELLRRSGLSSEQEEMLNLIEDSAGVLRAQLDDVLDLSRIEAGRVTLERIAFDLHEVLERTVAVQQPDADARGIFLRLEADHALPRVVVGDPSRLRQVLHNLISNALKFTADGGVVVRARALEAAGEQVTVRFEVADTGIGIEPDALAGLWQPFRQADATTRRRFGGTGLGLTIVRKLVERAGGTVDVVSRPGAGSTFGVVLPLELGGELPAAGVPSETGPATLTGRVLIVEDQRTNRQIAVRQLAVLGVEADAVADGAQAVEAVQRGTYALVLMDCQMPVMDGFAATRAIRSLDHPAATIPIVALTANAMEGDRERCLASGMDWYLTKPVGLDELRAALGTWLGGDEPAKPAAPPRQAARATHDGFDADMLDELARDLGSEGLALVVDDFLSELPKHVTALEEAVAARDDRAVIRAAHALKSPSRALGLIALADGCAELELLGRMGELPDVRATIDAIADEAVRGVLLLRHALGMPSRTEVR